MSTLLHALGPTNVSNSTPSGRPPVADDTEVKPRSTYIVPKEEDNDHLQDAGMDDLFGNDDDLEPKDDEDDSKPESSRITGTSSPSRQGSEERQRHHLEYREGDESRDLIQRVEKDVPIPNLPVPKSSDGDHWVIRMPNFVKVDSKPFHPDTYMGPEHDDEELQHVENLRERSMTIKLKVENTVRWRWGKDEFGQDIRQSNSRVIRWSDGTLSLRLGKELFDINQTIDTSGISRGPIGGSQASQSQSQESTASKPKSQGLTYLVAQHKRAQVLQAEALITGYMTLRPTGMQSETHRMLVRAVGQKHNKVARLRMAPDPVKDPEREVAELSKLVAKKSKKKPTDDGSSGRKRRSGYSRKRTADVWSDDDEEHEYVGSEEDEDDRMGEIEMPKARNEGDSKKGRGDYEEDDFLIADESDDGSERGERTRKRPRDLDEVEDPLDQMEAKIREQEHEERKKRHRSDASQRPEKTGDSDEGEDEEMDIESEEEEEDIKVRRTGAGTRKKRAIDFEEEDE